MDIDYAILDTEMDTARVEAALGGLVKWLLSKPVLRPAQQGAGVVNFLTETGEWDGLYPEICGYYLQFAAHAAPAAGTGDDTPFRSAAAAVATWLDAMGGAAA